MLHCVATRDGMIKEKLFFVLWRKKKRVQMMPYAQKEGEYE